MEQEFHILNIKQGYGQNESACPCSNFNIRGKHILEIQKTFDGRWIYFVNFQNPAVPPKWLEQDEVPIECFWKFSNLLRSVFMNEHF